MAKVFDALDAPLRRFIERQPLFFVASAPLSADGRVNLSPKGPISSLAILGPHRVAYLDVIGSGAETIAHVRENERITLMFCAFEGPPRILRLHGRGTVHLAGDAAYEELLSSCAFGELGPNEARRAIVSVDVERVSDACGYGVPLMEYVGERPHYRATTEKKLRVGGPQALERYRTVRNARSIDGLPALAD
jgi:hypothetical protein